MTNFEPISKKHFGFHEMEKGELGLAFVDSRFLNFSHENTLYKTTQFSPKIGTKVRTLKLGNLG